MTVWCSNNIDEWNNSYKLVPTIIAPHYLDVVHFQKYITLKPFITPRERDTEQVLCTMNVDLSLGYWSHKTSHSSSQPHNVDNEFYEEEGLEVSLGEESCGHRLLETSHSSSSHYVGCGCKNFLIIHSPSHNCGGYVGRGGSWWQDTSLSSNCKRVIRDDV